MIIISYSSELPIQEIQDGILDKNMETNFQPGNNKSLQISDSKNLNATELIRRRGIVMNIVNSAVQQIAGNTFKGSSNMKSSEVEFCRHLHLFLNRLVKNFNRFAGMS